MSRQYTIDFGDLEGDPIGERPLTPASQEPESVTLRRMIQAPQPISDGTLYYMSFGSGSSGNSYYIGTRRGGVIVDVGVRAEIIADNLKRVGIGMDRVKGVLLTHDHTDHSKYVYTLLRSNKHLRLYCTNRVLNALLRRHNISRRIKDYHVPVFKEFEFELGDLAVTAFDVPHDSADNAGYHLQSGDRHFVIATDMGTVSERASHYMRLANYLVIESNYDSEMLARGPYPEYLKARIRTDHGHLDNSDCASFLADAYAPHLSHIFLCHLSKDNNTPQKALEAVRKALEGKGIRVGSGEETIEDRECDVQLTALPRYDVTRLYVLRH